MSGYGNASSGKTSRKQVNEQAGIFAEDGGYHINADSVHLKGGAIASTNAQNSLLQTNKLTFEDIKNESDSKAMSASLSGSIKESKEKWVDNETGEKVKPHSPNSTFIPSQRSGGLSPGLPMLQQSSDSSLTKATLTEGTILLNKDTTPVLSTALELGINTDLSQANSQVAQTKDVKAQIQEQQQIATAIGHVQKAVETYTANQQEAAEQEVRRLDSQKQRAIAQGNAEALIQINRDLNSAKEAARDWGTSGSYKRIADAVTNVLTSAIAGAPTEAIATTAISPWINQEIKRLTTNKTTGEVDKTTNAIAHAVWGAIEAASAKGNATAGAVAGASSELAAPLIAKALYGTDDPKVLTEEQKQNIINLSSLTGAIGAGIAEGNGNSTKILTTANQGGEIGKRAVENNFFEQAYKSADYTNGLLANEKTKQDIEQVKKDVTQVLREEHPVIAIVGDGIYAVGSATGKVIYVSREVLLQVAPIILAPEIAGGLKVGQAIQLAAKYPKVAEAIIAGGVSTGFDVYNGEANYEKTLANFALAGIKAGKSTSQQLSIDAIYNGLTLANDKTKSDEEVKDLSISKIVGSVASISIDYGFKSNGIGKQVITNVIGNYTENRVSETIKNNKKKDGGKID